MLIVLGGLPGVGKTSIARELARQTSGVHVRIDSLEQAIRASGVTVMSLDDAGYRAGYAVARTQGAPTGNGTSRQTLS